MECRCAHGIYGCYWYKDDAAWTTPKQPERVDIMKGEIEITNSTTLNQGSCLVKPILKRICDGPPSPNGI